MFTPALSTQWQSLERDRLRALQGRKLHRYLRDCVLPFSPHYREVFARVGLTAGDIRTVDDLAKIPFTSKEELLPTPENPRKALEFVLKPDPAVLRRRPATIFFWFGPWPCTSAEGLSIRRYSAGRAQA